MKLRKIVALALVAMLLVLAVSCEEAKPAKKTMTITIHRGSNGEVLSTINGIPASITTWAELIASEYNHFDEFDWYGGFGHDPFDRIGYEFGSVCVTNDNSDTCGLCDAQDYRATINDEDALLVKDVYLY